MVIFMNFEVETLEFGQIKKLTSKYLYSNKARELLMKLTPSNNYEIVKNELNKTNEMMSLLIKFSKIPFLPNFDNNLILDKPIDNKIYSSQELLYLKLYLKMEEDINNHFKELINKDLVNYLKPLLTLNSSLKLYKELNKIISDSGLIYDDASIELKRIRLKTKSLEQSLNERLLRLVKNFASYLTDTQIVKRNNRFCLQVKETYKNKIKGVVHDISSSGQTVFIEPEASLIISSEIEMNSLLEQREITKILNKLTNLINDDLIYLKANIEKLIELDLINSKASYAIDLNAIMPKINNLGLINLVKAKHPLIDQKAVVPIDLSLDKDFNTLLITGPNTGGKTVSLKTTGLLSIMVQSGFLVPVHEDSNFNVFDNIFADIGDEQSILNSLSTFSSHITKIISFLEKSTNNSLILLDELGSGTDPNEGISLAIAIIEEFLKKDVRLIVTSHFSELKTYAYEQEKFKTASVAFDIKTLEPLYYLEHGISGESHARLIAKRLGLNNNVIARANDLFKERETEAHKIIEKLNLERKEYEILKKSSIESKENYEKSLEELEMLKVNLIKEQNLKIEQITKDEQAKWELRQEEIDRLIEKLEKDYSSHHLANLKHLRNSKITKSHAYDQNIVLKVGDQVLIKPYGQIGQIKAIKGNKYQVKFGIFDLEFSLKDLELTNEPKKVKKEPTRKNKPTNKIDVDRSAHLSIDLRGYRYEEVSLKLDKAFDQAILSNIQTLTIIHGFGTFAVRDAVYEYLKKSTLVKSYRYGKEGEGLQGVTVVTLK